VITAAIILVVLLLLSAIFAGSETALFMVRRDRALLALEKTEGGESSSVLQLVANPSRLLMSVLLGNLLVNMSFFAVSTVFVLKVEEVDLGAGVLVSLGSLLVVIVFGEILPKTLASVLPLPFSRITAPFILLVMRSLTPVTRVMTVLVESLNRLLGIHRTEEGSIDSSDLESLVGISSTDSFLSGSHAEVMVSVMRLHTLKLKEITTPRVEVLSCPADAPIEDIMKKAREWKTSLIPLHAEHHDLIDHYIDCAYLLGQEQTHLLANNFALPLPVFSELARMDLVLNAFLKNSHQLALVVDEYGEMSGIVTWNDVMACLRKRISKHLEKVDGKEAIILQGRTHVKDIPALEGQEEEDSVTLGGLICDHLGRLPVEGEMVKIGSLRLVVSRATPTQVLEVIALPKKKGRTSS